MVWRPHLLLTACLVLAVPPSALRQTRDSPLPAPIPLGELVREAGIITVLEVEKTDLKKLTVTFKTVAVLKGKADRARVEHKLIDLKFSSPDNLQSVLRWARPGSRAVSFSCGYYSFVCVGNFCYLREGEGVRSWGNTEPLFSFARCYVGSVEKLQEHVRSLLAGKEAVITAQSQYGIDWLDTRGSPVERDWLRGKKGRVWRIKAKLPPERKAGFGSQDAEPPEIVGWGMGETVPALTAALESKDSLVRAEAAEDLGQMGAPARSALPALRRSLRDPDGFVRVHAAEALARIDPQTADALAPLLVALREKNPALQRAALAALVMLGPRARSAVPALLAALDNREAGVRSAAARALGEIGFASTLPAGARIKVIEALARLLRHDRAIEVRYQSVRALLQFGADVWAAAPALGAALNDERDIASVAARILARLDPPAVQLLTEACIDPECQSPDLIADCLARLGPRARLAGPALAATFASADSNRQGWSISTVVLRIDPNLAIRQYLPFLLKQACDPDFALRGDVVDELEHFAPYSAAALAGLHALQKDNHAPTCEAADVALRRAQAGNTNALGRLLSDAREGVRDDAAMGLAKLGPRARVAVPALRRALRDEEESVRRAARLALFLIEEPRAGQSEARARQALVRLLITTEADREAQFGWDGETNSADGLNAEKTRIDQVIDRFVRILVDGSEVTARLNKGLKSRSVHERAVSALALCHLHRRQAQARPVLRQALADCPLLLLFLADALAGLGPDGHDLVPWLQQRLHDPNEAVYLAASCALRGIAPEAEAEVWGLASRRGKRGSPALKLSADQLESCWRLLAEADAVEAYRTVCRVILAGDAATGLLKERVRPVLPVTRDHLDRLIAALDSSRFGVRQQAAAELEALEELAGPSVRLALKGRPGLEKRRRLEQLLAKLDPMRSPTRMRLLRSVEILEGVGTSEAKEILKRLSGGAPTARLTQEAKAALQRLSRKRTAAP